jgi:hydrogenase maturation protease
MIEPPTLVLGLGNPLLGDDGVGWRVVEAVQREPPAGAVEFDWHAGGGLALMERLIGYERAVIVDALQMADGPAGSVWCGRLEELPPRGAGHLVSAHETSLQVALEAGRRLGAALPRRIDIVGVAAQPRLEFDEQLSPAVAAAVPSAAAHVRRLLEGGAA